MRRLGLRSAPAIPTSSRPVPAHARTPTAVCGATAFRRIAVPAAAGARGAAAFRRVAVLALLVGTGACHARTGPSAAATPDSLAVRRDIAYLASDALEGRMTGTPGNDSAAAYIARRYAALRLRPLSAGYLQPFDGRSAADVHTGHTGARLTQNVVALLAGTDPNLRGEYVVVGAHFDHLGRESTFAQDPEAGNAIRHGADDNASGTAAVMELARLFARRPAKRSILFVDFSGEELGLLGSRWFVEHAPVPLDSVQAMVNFDMVGRLRDDKLIVYGTASATELKGVVDSANAAQTPPLRVTAVGDGFGPSDQSSFYEKGIPVLHFFTDLHDDYHKATDVASKIDAGGEARVIALAQRVVRALADRPSRLTYVRTAAPQRAMAAGPESSVVYLGSVPDMAASDVVGMRLTGVRPGSPADLGGLKAGDVIVEFGGVAINDLYSYTDALYSHQPGDKVKVVVLRDGKRVELEVTLGRRAAS